jgi:peptidoglycan glycosyltransferase
VNRQVRLLALGLIVCFAVVFVQLNRIQVFNAKTLNDNPQNTRQVVRDFTRPRGDVITADGVVVAQSVPSNDRYQWLRQYPTKELFGQVTGYFSFLYGTDGIERQYSDVLAGQTGKQKIVGLGHLFDDRANTGDVTLTLRDDVQKVAAQALGNRLGSVVALDPRTGAVLAAYSWPSYDPNQLASHNFAQTTIARNLYLANSGNPMLANFYRERYFPGSTFKVITASAGLDSGLVTPTSPVYPVSTSYTPPGTTRPIKNFNNEACGGVLSEILRVSCNTAFAQMGVTLGGPTMSTKANAFGFNSAPPIDLPRPATSVFPTADQFVHDIPKLAQSSFGQNDVQATPLEMALVAAGIAHGGVIMAPYVVSETRTSDGTLLDRTNPKPWLTALTPQSASIMTSDMILVATSGTATRVQIPGVTVAAKTGTAQLGTTPPTSNAWLIAFAPAEAPRVAVAVLVNNQPGNDEVTGGTIAAPIAKAVIQAVLATPDPLANH